MPAHMTKVQFERYKQARFANGADYVNGRMIGGLLRVPSEQIRPLLEDLHKSLSWAAIAFLASVDERTVRDTFRRPTVNPKTAAKIRSLWEDYCGAVEKDERRFPAEPLLKLAVARYGTLEASGDRRSLLRLRESGLSFWQADRWAQRFGKMAHELWSEAV